MLAAERAAVDGVLRTAAAPGRLELCLTGATGLDLEGSTRGTPNRAARCLRFSSSASSVGDDARVSVGAAGVGAEVNLSFGFAGDSCDGDISSFRC
jgi:hypothetical protein